MEIIIRDKNTAGIPLLEVFLADRAAELPILFLVHEFSASKETYLKLGYQFAKQGYFVVTFDAHLHGELETPEFRKLNFTAKLEKLFELWTGTSQYISTLVRYYKKQPPTRIRRIGLIGVSMGGFAIFHYLSQQSKDKVDVAICLNSSPSWLNIFKMMNREHPGMDRHFTEEFLRIVMQIQPSNCLEHFGAVPILILNGEKDDKISLDDLLAAVEGLKTVYPNKSHVKSIVYKGVGHKVIPPMLHESEKWLKRFLLDTSSS